MQCFTTDREHQGDLDVFRQHCFREVFGGAEKNHEVWFPLLTTDRSQSILHTHQSNVLIGKTSQFLPTPSFHAF
jgi:hypothetical protein